MEVDFTDGVKLVEEGLDLAIRITLRLLILDVARRIGSSRLVVASPEYLRRHGEPTHPQELADRECPIYLPAQQGDGLFWWTGRCGRIR